MKRPQIEICGFCDAGNHDRCREWIECPGDRVWKCKCKHKKGVQDG